jgi:Ca2+-binding RTX toxin-like protein
MLRSLLLAALAALMLAAPARAADVALDGATLAITAAPGEENRVAVTLGSGSITVQDSGAAPAAGAGCEPAGPGRVTCGLATDAVIALGDRNDTLTVGGALPVAVTDGEGNDSVGGGSGADVFVASPGADTYTGGIGVDTIDYGARTAAVTLDLDGFGDDGAPGEGDNVRPGVERVLGGGGDDRLTGSPGADQLEGGPGDDRLAGGNGDDRLAGGDGDDDLRGDAGADTADYADRSAPLTVDLAGGRGGGAGETDALAAIEHVAGGAGADDLRGDGAANRLEGGPGDDRLDGRAGRDILDGGAGTDTIDYSARTKAVTVDLDNRDDDGESGERDTVRAGAERLLGGAGGDRLTGTDAAETLAGGAGNDRLDGNGGSDAIGGGDGDDQLWGDAGDDALDGGAGRDTHDGGAGNDAIAGGEGDDRLTGGDGNDALDGGAGDDSVSGGRGGDHLVGGEGNDALWGHDDADTLIGAAGNDTLSGSGGDDRLDGGVGIDKLGGDDGNDALDGGADPDSVSGGNGNDALEGGPDPDSVSGGYGDDALSGGDANDRLGGGAGADLLDGGSGDDDLRGDDGADRLLGSDGNDRIWGGNDADVLNGGAGADEFWGDGGVDTADYATRTAPLILDADNQPDDGENGEADNLRDSVENVIGGAGNDRITGSGGNNDLYGEGGDDVLRGEAGTDKLVGGAGADRLNGGAGADLLDGGPGRDRLDSRDALREAVWCGPGKDRAYADKADRPDSCEKVVDAKAGGGAAPNTVRPQRSVATRVTGVRRRVGGGRFVALPGFPGESIDRRLIADIRHLVRKYRVHITDGYAREGHAAGGEHPRGLAVDIVPGPGGSWSDVDRLAKWAEPRQGRPRAPFRWVGYNGDYNHGRGNHLHLSWAHSPTPQNKPARVVYTLSLRAKATRRPAARRVALRHLAGRSNFSLGRKPSVRSGLRTPARCAGTGQLRPIWKGAARSFGISWRVLASITEVESGFGCNMGPSSAGAIGWTQFMPATWRMWGMDASGDGRADPYNGVDAIYSSARYLRASGAPRHMRKALYAYNHAWWYVDKVLAGAKKFR